jgi:hypothetical protein
VAPVVPRHDVVSPSELREQSAAVEVELLANLEMSTADPAKEAPPIAELEWARAVAREDLLVALEVDRNGQVTHHPVDSFRQM